MGVSSTTFGVFSLTELHSLTTEANGSPFMLENVPRKVFLLVADKLCVRR